MYRKVSATNKQVPVGTEQEEQLGWGKYGQACRYLFDGICDRRPVVPAQAAEDHGAEGWPDGESAARPHQRQACAVRGPPAFIRINVTTIFPIELRGNSPISDNSNQSSGSATFWIRTLDYGYGSGFGSVSRSCSFVSCFEDNTKVFFPSFFA